MHLFHADKSPALTLPHSFTDPVRGHTVHLMASFRILEHQVESSYIREWPHALAINQEERLYLSVKQYIPKDNPNPRPGDVTIVGAHANGFPKGTWSYAVP